MRSCFQDPRNLARTGAAVVALVLPAASLPTALRADSYPALQGYVYSCTYEPCATTKQPAAGVEVMVESGWGVGVYRQTVRSDRSGRFSVLGLVPGRYFVSTVPSGIGGFSCVYVDAVPGETAFLDLTFYPGAHLDGCGPVMQDGSSYIIPQYNSLYSSTFWY